MCISAILLEQYSTVLSATNTDFGTTETRSLTTSLISTSGRLLKTIMREERPLLLELQDLFCSFHLYHTLPLVFEVFNFWLLHIQPKIHLPGLGRSDQQMYGRLFSLGTFLRHDHIYSFRVDNRLLIASLVSLPV